VKNPAAGHDGGSPTASFGSVRPNPELMPSLSSSVYISAGIAVVIMIRFLPPDGSVVVFIGRHGAIKSAGRVRCNMRNK